MKACRQILSALLAFVLSLTLVAGVLALLAQDFLFGERLISGPGRAMRKEQVASLGETISALATRYGFDEESVRQAFDEKALNAYGNELRAFIQSLLQPDGAEEEEETGVIFPYYMWEDGLDVIQKDPGFQASVPRLEQRRVSQDAIVSVLEKEVRELVFPIRPQLVIAGYSMAGERVDIRKAAGLMRWAWVIPAAAAAAVVLLLAIGRGDGIRWTGSGLLAGCLSTAAVFGFIRWVGISDSAGLINARFAAYLRGMFVEMLKLGAWVILPALAVGLVCVFAGKGRKA